MYPRNCVKLFYFLIIMKIHINKITKFYPYEAVFISGVFMETRNEDEYKAIAIQFFDILKGEHSMFMAPCVYHGFNEGDCFPMWDNKITFEVEVGHPYTNNIKLYFQFYEGILYIGSGVFTRNFNPETHYIEFL